MADLRNPNRHRGKMGVTFQEFLSKTYNEYSPNLMVVETPPSRLMGAARMILLGLFWQAQMFAASKKMQITTINPSTLKKWATGDARATKDRMVAEAFNRGIHTIDDNHADAYLLLAYQYEILGQPVPRTVLGTVRKNFTEAEARHWALQNCS